MPKTSISSSSGGNLSPVFSSPRAICDRIEAATTSEVRALRSIRRGIRTGSAPAAVAAATASGEVMGTP